MQPQLNNRLDMKRKPEIRTRGEIYLVSTLAKPNRSGQRVTGRKLGGYMKDIKHQLQGQET